MSNNKKTKNLYLRDTLTLPNKPRPSFDNLITMVCLFHIVHVKLVLNGVINQKFSPTALGK